MLLKIIFGITNGCETGFSKIPDTYDQYILQDIGSPKNNGGTIVLLYLRYNVLYNRYLFLYAENTTIKNLPLLVDVKDAVNTSILILMPYW